MDIKLQIEKVLQDKSLLVMTKCLMREVEQLAKSPTASHWVKETLRACQNTIKIPCKHSGGILSPDDCMKSFVGSRNQQKVFVATQDEELRNYYRNEVGVVPIFFLKNCVLILDSPSELTKTKLKIKEQLKLEPTKFEKKFLRQQQQEVDQFLKEERQEERTEQRAKIKDLLCMGQARKLRAGPHPMSVLKKQIKKPERTRTKARRLRKGKRSRELSRAKMLTRPLDNLAH